MKRIYFARAMEGLEKDSVHNTANRVRSDLKSNGFDMIDTIDGLKLPDLMNPFDFSGTLSGQIVQHDLALLRQADGVLMDMTIPKRNYVGCVCELVYANMWKKPTVVYVGDSGNDKRHWLIYHADVVCFTFRDALEHLKRIFYT
jgi:nucleoside 2-deoxyribosyltransferase